MMSEVDFRWKRLKRTEAPLKTEFLTNPTLLITNKKFMLDGKKCLP